MMSNSIRHPFSPPSLPEVLHMIKSFNASYVHQAAPTTKSSISPSNDRGYEATYGTFVDILRCNNFVLLSDFNSNVKIFNP